MNNKNDTEFVLDFLLTKKEKESWKKINSFPVNGRYEASNLGNIRTCWAKKPRILKQTKNENGYLKVGLFINKKNKSMRVHRLVISAFWDCPLDTKMQVNHIDGNKTNNNIENLELVTNRENTIHAYATGLYKTKKLVGGMIK